ncbi:MAG TPA: hypothetical protein VG943_00440 [Caulobacterales bacterium]|nr:hypothetical protein [Caulobacterales bacterium]
MHLRRAFAFLVAFAALCGASFAQTSEKVEYTYDALGRVITVTYTTDTTVTCTITYTYDAAGNRTQVVQTH